MGHTAHVDTFARDNLPPRDQWPELLFALRSKDERGSSVDEHQALFAARSGVAHAMVQLADEDNPNRDQDIGSPDDLREFGGGTYWVDLQPDPSGSYLVSSFAQVRGQEEAVEALLSPVGSDIYDHALFAGNVSGDPGYTMELGGSARQADEVRGDVYSGGDVDITGDATVDGDIRAGGSIEGGTGDEGGPWFRFVRGFRHAGASMAKLRPGWQGRRRDRRPKAWRR